MKRRRDAGLWEPTIAQRKARDGVARAFGIEPHAIASRSRKSHTVRARHAAAWVIKQRWPKLTWTQLGALMGGRDHSTVIHAVRHAEILREREAAYRAVTDGLVAGAPVVVFAPLPPKLAPAQRVERRVDAAMSGRSVKPKNDFSDDDFDGLRRARGSVKLAEALARAGYG